MRPQPSTLNFSSHVRNDQPSINLHIERLVLDGLPMSHGQGVLVQAAIETELTRLLAEQGFSSSSAATATRLSADSVRVTQDSKPASMGHQIAQAIYASLTPSPLSPRETRFSEGPNG
jgi:hypothetical protein